MLPPAPYTLICDAKTAELIKYGSNAYLFNKIVFSNMFFELVEKYLRRSGRAGLLHPDAAHALAEKLAASLPGVTRKMIQSAKETARKAQR